MTLAELRALLSNPNVAAFLRVIRARESGQDDLAFRAINTAFRPAANDPRFEVIDGKPYFKAWDDHPFAGMSTLAVDPDKRGYAAGAGQFIPSTWAEVAAKYGITDFSPMAQLMGMVGRVIYRGALDDVLAGRIVEAIVKCRKEWTSLPGAQESTAGWTMDKALAVYRMYGGILAIQGAAPIEDKSTEYSPPVRGKPEETPMGAIALPLLSQLLPQVLGLFSGRAQATIAEKTGADPKLAADFMQAMIAQVGHAVGVPVVDNASATQAVAALTAAPQEDRAAKAKALEAQALATLDQLLKAGDKMAEWDSAMWAAQLAGRRESSAIAIKEKMAGLWDMTPALIKNTEGQTWFILIALVGGLVYAVGLGKEAFFTGLIGIAGGAINQVLKNKAQANDYRFDGTKESSEQSKAITKALAEKSAQ